MWWNEEFPLDKIFRKKVSSTTKMICLRWVRKCRNKFQKMETTIAKIDFSPVTQYFNSPSHKLVFTISMNSFLCKKIGPGFLRTVKINSNPITFERMAN